MHIAPFKLERYFAKHEFSAAHLLSPSDCESLSLAELLQLADAGGKALWERLSLGYTESAGHPALRTEVARLYSSMPPRNVLIAAPEEAIFLATNTLLEPGDRVVAVAPAYQSLHEIPRAIGCELTPWQLEPGPKGWRLDLDRLADTLTDRTRMLILNFPHNPTGFLPTRDELRLILDLAAARGIHVFSDEMYRLLEHDPAARLPSVCDLYERGIALSGLSKTFGLPGLRIGWLVTADTRALDRCLALKDYTTICSSAPSEILAILALRAKQTILARNLAIVRRNLQLARELFAAHKDLLEWIPPRGGSTAFPRWLADAPVERFCERMLESHDVMIVPGSLFDSPGNHFRIGLGRRSFPDALAPVATELADPAWRQRQ
jgi:aspartate/methionine/tyrosine aminotransferase